MLKSLKNIFSTDQSVNLLEENTEIDVLSGLMIEAANTDGKITQDELNKISSSLINIFKEIVMIYIISEKKVVIYINKIIC